MHKKGRFLKISRYSFMLVICVSLSFFASQVRIASSDDTPSLSFLNITSTQTSVYDQEFTMVYTTLLTNRSLARSSVVLDGNTRVVISLPENSTALQLPDNKTALILKESPSSVLPQGSKISYVDDKPVVIIPGEPAALQVENVLIFPVEKVASNAVFQQSIHKLNTYELAIAFPAFHSPILQENTVNYTIDWGDGTIETHSPDTVLVNHIYSTNGTYPITININDDFGYTYTISSSFTIDYEGDVHHTYLVLDANKEPLAVTTTASLSLMTLAFLALSETGKYKLLALLLISFPLFTRIQKEDVLDQFVRGQIYGYIKTNPGAHYNQIRRTIDVKNGTLSYHLRVLEKTELIKSRREGLRYRAFYPTGMKFPKEERFRLTELQIKILDLIQRNPGINQKDIAEHLKKKPQTINYNIGVLEQADLIEVRRIGRKTGCYPLSASNTVVDSNQKST